MSRVDDAELIKWLWRRVDALEKLNTAYRTGSRPAEKTLDELARTREALAAVPRG
jgi:hypothetical protein